MFQENLEHQSHFCPVPTICCAHIHWSTGCFINMLQYDCAPFSSWDPTGLISSWSLFNSTGLPSFFFLHNLLHVLSLSCLIIFFWLSSSELVLQIKCLIVIQAKETGAPMQSDVLHLKLHVQAFN